MKVEWWFEEELGEYSRRAVLWDCKREPLRGLGVNIGEGQNNSPPKDYKLLRSIFRLH